MHTIIIAGPPGCGKGTQAKLLAKHLGYEHISTGNILRDEISKASDLGILAKACIDDGNFVPDDIACEMISKFMDDSPNIKGAVFDGFPRTVNQCYEFDKMLDQKLFKVEACIKIDVDEELLVDRLVRRNEELQRPDDSSIDIIEHRFKLYLERTKPVSDYYNNKGICKFINGNGSVNQVFDFIKNIILINI